MRSEGQEHEAGKMWKQGTGQGHGADGYREHEVGSRKRETGHKKAEICELSAIKV